MRLRFEIQAFEIAVRAVEMEWPVLPVEGTWVTVDGVRTPDGTIKGLQVGKVIEAADMPTWWDYLITLEDNAVEVPGFPIPSNTPARAQAIADRLAETRDQP